MPESIARFLRRMALRPKKFTQSVEQKRIRTFGEDYAEEARRAKYLRTCNMVLEQLRPKKLGSS